MKSGPTPMLHALWDDLSDFPASRIDEGLDFLMRWFHEHLAVDNVTWLGILRMLDENAAASDPFNGWRVRARQSLLPRSEHYEKLIAAYFSDEHFGRLTPAFYRKGSGPEAEVHVGTASRTFMREAGAFRVHRLRDGWIDYAKFRRTEHYRLYYKLNDIADRIWIAFPVSPTVESIFLLDRLASGPNAKRRFTPDEADLAGTALRGLKEFHRRLLLGHGVLRNVKPLSPLKRRLLQELLSAKSEKEIAATMKRKPTTIREYVRELYAEYGVRTRTGLMALWLGEI